MSQQTRVAFAELMRRSEDRIDLARAALLFASEEYPHLDIDHYLGELDRIGEQVRDRVAGCGSGREKVQEMNRVLFGELGFHGNRSEYYDPRNSFLNDVLERRTGIPITLSLVYIEIAWRAGLPIVGVGLPGHFIVKLAGVEEVLLDPFNGGHELNRDQCRRLASSFLRDPNAFTEEFLGGISPQDLLCRMLRNLKAIYVQQSDFHKLLWVCDFLLTTRPDSYDDLRDRGLVFFNLKRFSRASTDWRQYLEAQPNARDAERIRGLMKQAWRLQAMMN